MAENARDKRITIIDEHEERMEAGDSPLLVSKECPWDGYVLEVHNLPAGEFPARSAVFEDHMIFMQTGAEPYRKYWRENGRERSVEVMPGDIALCSRQEITDLRWDKSFQVTGVAIQDAAARAAIGDAVGGKPAEFAFEAARTDPVLQHLLMAMRGELQAGCPTGRLFGELLGTAATVYTLSHYGVFRPRIVQYRGGLSQRRLRQIFEYIDAGLDRDLGVSELAGVAGMSPYHFGRLFRQSVGLTVHQYVLSRRIEKAKALLADERVPLVQVAMMCGMPNQSHFTQVFRQNTGITPKAYRSGLK